MNSYLNGGRGMLWGEKEVSDDAEICLDWSLFLQMEPDEEVCWGLSERLGEPLAI